MDRPDPNQVRLDVFATDSLGHAVRGLAQQDFTVRDNGQPVPLTGFRAVDTTTTPNAVSVLLVVDMLNDTTMVVEREREQIGEFLNQDGGKLAYPVSIAAMTESGVKLMQGYSQDGHQVLAAFKGLKNEMRTVGRSAGFYGAAERMEESLVELTQISRHLEQQGGHKIVIIISPGWAMMPMAGVEETNRQRAWVFDALVQLTNMLREGRITLYSVDPFMLGRTDPFYYTAYLKPVKKMDQAEFPYLALQVLAEHSGGAALTTGNDVVGGINAALRNAGAFYELSFQAPPGDRNNEYHELRVQIDKPNVKARTHAFYYARPAPSIKGKTTPPSKVPAPGAGLP